MDDGLGQLKTNVVYPAEGTVFTNQYNEPAPPPAPPSEPSEPSGPVPPTGDGTPILLFAALMAISVLVIICLLAVRRRSESADR